MRTASRLVAAPRRGGNSGGRPPQVRPGPRNNRRCRQHDRLGSVPVARDTGRRRQPHRARLGHRRDRRPGAGTVVLQARQRKPMAGGPATYAFDAFGTFWGRSPASGTGQRASSATWPSPPPRRVISPTSSASAPARCMARCSPSLLLWLVTLVNLVSPRFVGQFDGPLLVAGLIPAAAGGHGWLDARSTPRSSASRGMSAASRCTRRCRIRWCSCSGRSRDSRAPRWPRPWSRIPSAMCRIATIAGVLIAALIYIAREHRDLRPGAGRRNRRVERAVRARGREDDRARWPARWSRCAAG